MSKDAVKKEKKDKKRSDDGVKKEKKEKKSRKSLDVSEHVAVDEDGDVVIDESVAQIVTGDAVPTLALVPFANPLADDKNGKKVLKTVKKGTLPRILFSSLHTDILPSRKSEMPQARRQRGGQGGAQVTPGQPDHARERAAVGHRRAGR